jgi:hypothetical protein
MCFDALTIGGLLIALVSVAFLVGLVSHNDRLRPGVRAAHREQVADALTRD